MSSFTLDFEQAKAKHLLFKSRLRSILYGIEVDETPVASQYECGLGKWIYDYALQVYSDMPELLELEKVHANIHTTARKLIGLHKAGKVNESRKGLAEIDLIADELIALLNTIEKKLEAGAGKQPVLSINNTNNKEYHDLRKLNEELDGRIQQQIEDSNRSNIKYEAVLAALQEGIIIQDMNGVIQSANHSAEVLLGLTAGEIYGRSSMDPSWGSIYEDGTPMPGEERAPMLALKTGLPQINQLMGIKKGDGSLAWLSINSQPLISNEDHKITGVVTSFFDVTEARRVSARLEQSIADEQAMNEELAAFNEELVCSNEALAIANEEQSVINEELRQAQDEMLELNKRIVESEAKLRALADNMSQLAWMTDEEGSINWYNKRWYDYTGTTYEEMAGWGWQKVHDPEHVDRVTEKFKQHLKNGDVWEDTFPLRGANGEFGWFLSRAVPLKNDEGKIISWFGTNTDITEQRRDEQRKNDFIGMVSHELKTPLTSLNAYLQMLQAKAAKAQDSFTSGALDKCVRQVKKMTTMINGFLNVARLEAGKISIDKQVFDMAHLVKEIEEEIILTVNSHNIVFAPVVRTIVNADMDKMGQVINNFISNALKYSPAGTTINVACVTLNNHALVSVKDEGFGIAPADIEKLFDRYYRVEGKHTKTISGFGIGLYLCAEIIERHEGKIGVESQLGDGSNFWFTIPVVAE